ncbi:syntaxin [Rhodotorula diobovata]|uniref:Syntaxin n=1 Tax=Rhodotorula diobovata TaxID=5288 RepID=A0A5C5FLN8_9BASI|nr:syntaxin [Rhodotorula diobovata]
MSFAAAKAATSDPIQSVSVPSYTRLTAKPDPHVAYTVAVSLPTRTYSIQQRYSAFAALHHELAASCGAPPPADLPPKHPGSWFLAPLAAARDLTDAQLDERRVGLERWLRAILADRDPRWRSSRAFKDFLAAPPEGNPAGAGAGGPDAGSRDWTATAWTAEHAAVEGSARTLRTTLDRRDAQLLASSSSAHATAKEAKTALVDLVRRIGDLARGLQVLAKDGITDGELQRRSALVQRLQGEVEELGRKAGSGPRAGAGRASANGAAQGGGDEPPTAARQALLGEASAGRAPARVLGAAAAASLETPETRPLDNGGIMQLQQQYMDEQDSKLEALTAALRRQRHLGEMINAELALQEDVLDQLDAGTDRVKGKMKDAQKQMKRL